MKMNRKIVNCIYCGSNLNLDGEKRSFRVNGKKHKKNARDFCSTRCIRADQEFHRMFEGKIKMKNPEIDKKIQEVLWRQTMYP